MAIVHISHDVVNREPELMDLVFDRFGAPKDVTTEQDSINGRSVLQFDIPGYQAKEWVDVGIRRLSDGRIICDTLNNLINYKEL